MRFPPLAAICLPLALAACSGGEDGATDEGLDEQDVAERLADAPAIEPGLYESSGTLLEFEMAGMPQGQGESLRSMMAAEMAKPTTFCMTPEQAAQGRGEMLQHMAESDCTVTRLDTSADGVSSEMQCRGEGGLNGTVTVDGTMSGDTSSVVFETVQSVPGAPGEGARMKMRIDSRRIGPCPA
jgi:hypothetical protein